MPDAPTKPIEFAFNADKAVAVVAYLATQVPSLDRFKIAKLVYLADRLHVVRYGRPIVGGHYYALPHGPVPEELLDGVRLLMEDDAKLASRQLADRMRDVVMVDRSGRFPVLIPNACEEPNLDALSRTDIEVLNEIAQAYGRASFRQLYDETHSHAAYTAAWERRNENKRSVVMRYEDFFTDNPESVDRAKEAMLERQAIREALQGTDDEG